MSAIENLIRALRYYQSVSEIGYSEKFAVNEVCRDAADTIETLSAKLQAENMERSAEDCADGLLTESRQKKNAATALLEKNSQ